MLTLCVVFLLLISTRVTENRDWCSEMSNKTVKRKHRKSGVIKLLNKKISPEAKEQKSVPHFITCSKEELPKNKNSNIGSKADIIYNLLAQNVLIRDPVHQH